LKIKNYFCSTIYFKIEEDMNTTTLNENILTDVMAYVKEPKKSVAKHASMSPPEGFMTGDEFEKRVKERVTKFYKENGLL
jgi:hypothetical protein